MNKRKDVIPNNLKEYRKKCGYTQKQVSQMLSFTNEVSLSRWEKGVNIPNLINLIKLGIIYNTSISQLYISLTEKIEAQLIEGK